MANEIYNNKFNITYQFWMYKMCLAPQLSANSLKKKKGVHKF